MSKYDEVYQKHCNHEMLSDYEWDILIGCIIDKVEAGETVSDEEQRILAEECGFYEEEMIDTLRHGWVLMWGIYHFDDKFYACEYSFHDDYGCEFEDNVVLKEVEQRVIQETKWFPKEEK